MFDKQCLIFWPGFGKAQTINFGLAMFLDVAKRSNILLDKQISNVCQTMFDRLVRAHNRGCSLVVAKLNQTASPPHTFISIGNSSAFHYIRHEDLFLWAEMQYFRTIFTLEVFEYI